MAELIQKKLQGEVEKYQQLQKDLSKFMSGWQQLEAQLTENNIMKEELALLAASNVVFKLLGPRGGLGHCGEEAGLYHS